MTETTKDLEKRYDEMLGAAEKLVECVAKFQAARDAAILHEPHEHSWTRDASVSFETLERLVLGGRSDGPGPSMLAKWVKSQHESNASRADAQRRAAEARA